MDKNPFSSLNDEEFRNAAVYFYGVPREKIALPLFDLFEQEFEKRLKNLGKKDWLIPPEKALLYYDLIDFANENGSDSIMVAAQNAEENVIDALEQVIVPDLEITDDDLQRNEIDLRVYSADDPFEQNEDGTFIHAEFEKLANVISQITLVDDDENPTSEQEAFDEITLTLKISALSRLLPVLMHSREKIEEEEYFSMLYDQMVWDLAGMFFADEDLSEDESMRNATHFLKECGWA